jgi:hypothetical protein
VVRNVLHYEAGSLPHGEAVATDLSTPLIDFPSSLALGWGEGVDIRVRGKGPYKLLVSSEHLTGCWPDRWRQGLIFRPETQPTTEVVGALYRSIYSI